MKVGLIAKTLACVLAAGFPLVAFAGPAADNDGDTVPDVIDNCSGLANSGTSGNDIINDHYLTLKLRADKLPTLAVILNLFTVVTIRHINAMISVK